MFNVFEVQYFGIRSKTSHPVYSQIQKLENKCKYDFLIQTDSLWPLLVLSQTQISQILENRPYFELWQKPNS